MFDRDRNVSPLLESRVRRGRAALPGLVLAAALCVPAAGLAAQPNPERNAYFGEQHLHSSWSVDAWLFGNHPTGPDAALDYARGKPI